MLRGHPIPRNVPSYLSFTSIDMRFLLCAVACLLILSCSSEKQSGESGRGSSSSAGKAAVETSRPSGTPGGPFSVEIRPLEATRQSTFLVIPRGFSLSDATVEWLVNGESAVPSSGQFRASETKKGDEVQAKVDIRGEQILSNVVQIGNSRPVVSKVIFISQGLKPGEPIGVEVTADDADGDPVSFVYEWTKNGEPAGNGKSIAVPVRKGDKIRVRITPFDGEAYGQSVLADSQLKNIPPVIERSSKFSFDGKVYTYQVKATDADGDQLTYSLESGPSGMKIDSSSGLITWDVPASFAGKAPFTVVVSDGNGGKASQKLSVDIKAGSK
jgi:hypothetical protein